VLCSGKPQVRPIDMKSLRKNTDRRRNRTSGFSLLEVMTVLMISIVVSVVSVTSMIPVMAQFRLTNGYNTTLAAIRQARDNAVSQRTSYSVTFSNAVTPNTITVAPTVASGGSTFQGDQNSVTYQLPTGVTFYAYSTLASTPPPDGYGTGANAIDFGYTSNGVGTGGQTTFYFCPDGSAQDAEGGSGNCAGSWDGGVVYIAQQGNLLSSRAVDLWGATGRIHGWRLYPVTGGGNYQWIRQ
jgi:Tfp pilus assembly protein FimT